MKREYRLFKFLVFFVFVTPINSQAQQTFTIISSRANNYCNGSCTLLDNPDLNGNPNAVIFITPVEVNGINLNPHPICAYYISKQWSIMNMDNSSMPPGSQFNVQYYPTPDDNHFIHVVSQENLVKKISYINHAGLNDNPHAHFMYFQNWAPSVRGGNYNRNEIAIQYDTTAHRWYISNLNDRQLEFPVAYNIIISNGGNTVVGPVFKNPVGQKEIITQKIPVKAYDFSNVHICFDKISQKNIPPRPAVIKIPKIKSNGQLDPVSNVEQELSVVTAQMWSPGETITVGFYSNETTPLVIGKVGIYAHAWETIANVKFQFISDVSKSEIKVGFINDNSSWSLIGRDVLDNPTGERTVNFGWFTNKTSETEFRRVILHEFGHVLGFIHEHQSPAAGIPWDKEKVYAFFGGSPNFWDKAKIDHNIFEKYSKTATNSSAYDPLSIMHYFFPPELVTDGSLFTNNTNFSPTDISFSKLVYPGPVNPPTATGLLLTNDDCDEIEFSVEYNVKDKNIIEFVIEPGRDANNNLITWWKKIAVPVLGNGEVGLEMQDGHYAVKTVPVAIIDKNRGISFGKAKGLGMHTGLNFTWNVWPAIVGGCKVKLVWRRDKC